MVLFSFFIVTIISSHSQPAPVFVIERELILLVSASNALTGYTMFFMLRSVVENSAVMTDGILINIT